MNSSTLVVPHWRTRSRSYSNLADVRERLHSVASTASDGRRTCIAITSYIRWYWHIWMASSRTTFALDEELAERARRLGVNISAAARQGVTDAVRAALARADRDALVVGAILSDIIMVCPKSWCRFPRN